MRCEAAFVRARSNDGFTLAEVLVALVLVSIIAAGLASLFALAMADARDARLKTIALALAAQKMEQLEALRWTDPVDDVDPSDRSSDLSLNQPAGGGAGLTITPADALDRNLPGCVDFLDSAGRWIGTAGNGSASATYVRRWSIQPLPADPVNGLVLRVFVAVVTTSRYGIAVTRRPGQPGQVLLISTRSRSSS